MRRLLTALSLVAVMGASAPLAGCATGAVPGVHAVAERADTDASLAYVAIATTVNAIEAEPTVSQDKKDQAEAIKRKAWAALGIAHQAYASGVVADISLLQDLLRQIVTLKGAQ